MNIVKDVFDPNVRLGSQTEDGFVAVQMNNVNKLECKGCCFNHNCPYQEKEAFWIFYPCSIYGFIWIEFDSDKDNVYE